MASLCKQSSLETDWCQADAMRESLREKMALLKSAYEKIEKLETQRIDEIVIGDIKITDGNREGTILCSGRQEERMVEAGLAGRWCQIVIRPVTTNP